MLGAGHHDAAVGEQGRGRPHARMRQRRHRRHACTGRVEDRSQRVGAVATEHQHAAIGQAQHRVTVPRLAVALAGLGGQAVIRQRSQRLHQQTVAVGRQAHRQDLARVSVLPVLEDQQRAIGLGQQRRAFHAQRRLQQAPVGPEQSDRWPGEPQAGRGLGGAVAQVLVEHQAWQGERGGGVVRPVEAPGDRGATLIQPEQDHGFLADDERVAHAVPGPAADGRLDGARWRERRGRRGRCGDGHTQKAPSAVPRPKP